jgi:hypothetical protein
LTWTGPRTRWPACAFSSTVQSTCMKQKNVSKLTLGVH